jgi:hypothetical protein
MDEILPGIMHWVAVHPNTGQPAHSAFLVESGTLIDPMVPDEGLGWFEEHRPARALLTNRHHRRGVETFARELGCSIHLHPAGLHEFEGVDVTPMPPGDTPAPGVTVLDFGTLTPEEVILHIAAGPGVIAIADSIARDRHGRLGFFSDSLLGDDPEAVKHGIRAGLRRILDEWEFDAMLMAHGEPQATGARAELEAFAAG